jgi:hypothetical protein
MEIVKIINDWPRVSTNTISLKTENEHRSIIRLIEDNIWDFLDFWKLEEWKENIKCDLKSQIRKWKSKVYHLNEWQSYLLITYLRNNDIIRWFKKTLIKEFLKMKNLLTNFKNEPWRDEMRLSWIPVRKTFTDAINSLYEYIKETNPNSSYITADKWKQRLYSGYTKAINNIFEIQIKVKNLRDFCNNKQLWNLKTLEENLTDIIYDEINKKTFYKDIYKIIKEKVNWFILLFWKTKIIDNQLILVQ